MAVMLPHTLPLTRRQGLRRRPSSTVRQVSVSGYRTTRTWADSGVDLLFFQPLFCHDTDALQNIDKRSHSLLHLLDPGSIKACVGTGHWIAKVWDQSANATRLPFHPTRGGSQYREPSTPTGTTSSVSAGHRLASV
eukprot:3059316-Rhodomonas_salina.4